MRNPYEDLGRAKPSEVKYEEVSGAFSCQTDQCYSTVPSATFIGNANVLTWKCEEGHVNKIEDFDIG